ncbi:ADP-ribosylglycohydrolase family protein [Oerskovia sp. KBS0722]|uniref:ADP-ribosylglycohydrolase family protein n=1 Tax=Oerskovia sp. KBS0722 TaxID=1179673 RepID=UPI00110F3B34|nr:ADP-ribosylglycohydrolase family protein [Oerskovia sp. KBS0722]QDW61725.1 hypothetical protein FFI11_003580 [Oerskovia sp. KBS0722]
MTVLNMTDRARRTVSSMLWSAWADAVGFVSELTDEAGLVRRLEGRGPLTGPVTWSRKIGGRAGVFAELPAGTYSDDTQLRLAVGRAIGPNGFDVEAFARVELPVWPAYALGGGRASKAAAVGMSRARAAWFANFFPGWTDAGGNGAAMRIQPHVWAAGDLAGREWVADVIRDAVITHGHPRALTGAVLMGHALAHALNTGTPPGAKQWPELLAATRDAVEVFETEPQLSMYWVPRWNQQTSARFDREWSSTVDELERMLEQASAHLEQLAVPGSESVAVDNPAHAAYSMLCEDLGLREDATRGSGTATVAAALALAAAMPTDPQRVTRIAANAIGTDTDTIATMAAAICGAGRPDSPPCGVQDEEYLRAEAHRLTQIAAGAATEMFAYPDLLHWIPPRAQLDATGMVEGRPALAGLGFLEPLAGSWDNKDVTWTWVRTDFGQSMLLRHRTDLPELPAHAHPRRPDAQTGPPPTRRDVAPRAPEADIVEPRPPRSAPVRGSVDVDDMLAWVVHRRLDDQALGYALRRVAQIGTLEQLIAFTTTARAEIRRNRLGHTPHENPAGE